MFLLVCANTVFERAMLLMSYAKYTECVLDILSYQESSTGPEKNFQNGGNHTAGKRYFEIGFSEI